MNKKNPREVLSARVAALRKRQRFLNSARGAAKGLFYGALLAFIFAGLAVLAPAGSVFTSPWLGLFCLPALAGLGALVGFAAGIDELFVARALDRAAESEDRFASALQLASHRRRARARLILEDAVAAVHLVPNGLALPWQTPRELKWSPLPVLLMAVIIWLAPSQTTDAQIAREPEITSEQWMEVQENFRRELNQMPKPQTDAEKEIVKELQRLAALLEKQPTKKEALAQIAELRSKLQKQQEGQRGRNLSLQRASQSVRSSVALRSFASELRRGEYEKAANELNSLAQRLSENAQSLTAEEFENVASDFDRLAQELASHEQLGQACQNCANAAASMNRQRLADALRRFAKNLKQDSKNLRRCDSVCRSMNMLDELKKRLNQQSQCKSCRSGRCSQCGSCRNGQCSSCAGNRFVRRSNKKGGLKAGWGTADNWRGGDIVPQIEQRMPAIAETREGPGQDTSYATLSPEERARSTQEYRELYAEMIQKAEADLALETVPIAYREYLRRYFLAIRPQDDAITDDAQD